MVRRTGNAPDTEPDQINYELPSETEHLFQVVDVLDEIDADPDIVHAKLEVVGGPEEGRSILNRLSLDDGWKGFFATRLFLKAIGDPYKGNDFPIDTDNWIGRQFFATVVHVESKGKTYANIDTYNFDKKIEQAVTSTPATKSDEIAWDQ